MAASFKETCVDEQLITADWMERKRDATNELIMETRQTTVFQDLDSSQNNCEQTMFTE